MMKNIKRILIIIILIISFSSCKKEKKVDENKPSSDNYVCAGEKDLTIGEIYEDELEPYTYIDYNFTIEESGYYNVSTIVNGYDDTYSNLWEVKLDYYFYNEHQMTYLLWDNTINQMANILWLDKLEMHYFVKNHSYTLTMRFIADYVLRLPKVNNPIKTYKIQVQKADYGLDRLWDYENQYFIFEPEESGIYSLGSYGDKTTLYYRDITNDEIFKLNDLNYKDIEIKDSIVQNTDGLPYFKKGNKYLLMLSISSSNDEEFIFNPKVSLITEETENLKKITIEKTGIYQFNYPESKFMQYKFYDEETTVSHYFQNSFIQLYEGMTLWYVDDEKNGLDTLEYTGYDLRCYVDGEEIINGHSYKYKLGYSHVKLSLTYNGEYVQATSNHYIYINSSSSILYRDDYFDNSDEGDFYLGFTDDTYKEPRDINYVYYRYGNVKINYLGVMTNINFEIETYDIRG